MTARKPVERAPGAIRVWKIHDLVAARRTDRPGSRPTEPSAWFGEPVPAAEVTTASWFTPTMPITAITSITPGTPSTNPLVAIATPIVPLLAMLPMLPMIDAAEVLEHDLWPTQEPTAPLQTGGGAILERVEGAEHLEDAKTPESDDRSPGREVARG